MVSRRPLAVWNPFREANRFWDEDFLRMPSLFRDRSMGWDLAVDVFEEKGNIVAEMHLPGVNPEKLDVSVENDRLRVSGERGEEKETRGKNYYSREIRRGSFERVVPLPASVQSGKAKAEYKDGVLRVTIPKRDQSGGKSVSVRVKR